MACLKIADGDLERLGIYFVHHDVYGRYGISFESFCERWQRGILNV